MFPGLKNKFLSIVAAIVYAIVKKRETHTQTRIAFGDLLSQGVGDSIVASMLAIARRLLIRDALLPNQFASRLAIRSSGCE